MTEIFEEVVNLRRELHQHPEIGFDLPKTLALVRRELDALGIEYTDKFGQSSIVATICPEKKDFTIGLRADMDALPIQEPEGVPFISQHPGCMHACGHDMHTATLLGVAKLLKQRESELNCRVKLLFTPAEEYVSPGCKQLAENGVMEDIDCILAYHVDPEIPLGMVAVDAGGQGANSMGFTVEFFGQTAHAASQHKGKDAISMAVEAYQAMHIMVAKEFSANEPRVLNIGTIHGGKTNNIVCDYCEMFGTHRTHSDEVSEKLMQRIKEICHGVAAMNGARAEVTVKKFLPFVINNEVVTQRIYEAAKQVIGEENIFHKRRNLGGEDFSFLCRQKPGMQFRVGTRTDEPRSALPLHNDKLIFDERALDIAMKMMVQFVLDNQNGITF